MRMPLLLQLFLFSLLCTSLSAPPASAQGKAIGFAEEFALAADREKALEQLIPGTEDYYFYSCLLHLHSGALEKVEPLLRTWIERHGRSERVEQIENRRALLSYGSDPRGTYAFLREHLELLFDDQREVPGAQSDLPSQLDPALISRATLMRRALQKHRRTLDGLRDPGLYLVSGSGLDSSRLLSLLKRLERPDFPNLPTLVVRDLESSNRRQFGSLKIHKNLLLEQLEECLQLRPSLLNEEAFVATYLVRLQPAAGVDWHHDAGERAAYLDRLWSFAQRLAPAHNSLKAHVLYRRLVHDRALGQHDKPRFMAYLRLPRRTPYTNPDYLPGRGGESLIADLGKKYPSALPPVRSDEGLVRAYLQHFFRSEDSYTPYARFVRSDYLKRLFAETKILYGQGDMEQWYSLLDDPGYYEGLKERVEIEFAPEQRRYYAGGEDVSIAVDLKNVETLLVKVFAINAFNFYRERNREVDAAIDLDGLVANEEQTYTYEENPLRRVRQRFEFPSLSAPGVYVVELIGNGMSSRAVIHKGRLQHIERTGSAGQVLRVLDEGGRHLRDASVWLGGHEYGADEDGEILIPYSTRPGGQSILLRHGARASLASMLHRDESYQLVAEIHIEREALLERNTAKILVRPKLRINGRAASLELLEDVVLSITSRDRDGISSTQDVRGFELPEGREAVHEIQVPAGLAQLGVVLKGNVRNLSKGEDLALSSSAREFVVNTIDASPMTGCALLGRSAQGYRLDMLGKNGEPQANRAVHLKLVHREFKDAIEVDLKTDSRGRIQLGALEGIASLRVSGLPSGLGSWELRGAARTYCESIHGRSAQPLRVPYLGRASSLSRSIVSLIELRGGVYARDRFEHVGLRAGFLELRGLPPGDYDLWLKEADHRTVVRIVAGPEREGWILGRDRFLPVQGLELLHITGVAVEGEELVVRLAHAGPDARVHAVATRYLPAFDPFDQLRAPADSVLDIVTVSHPTTAYLSGRKIADEYRYILERRYAQKFPGNMLARPGLILNPWALEETETGSEDFRGIGLGGGRGGKRGGRFGGKKRAKGKAEERNPGTFPNLGFLPEPAAIRANLRPDAQGVVRVPLSELGSGSLVHVLAVDADSTVYATHARAEEALVPRDRRLSRALDPSAHFTENKRIELVQGGGQAVVEDLSTSTVEPYDSLGTVFQLFATLSGNAELQEFAFILRWPELSPAEKRELYSEHACHELHFFLHEKDPEFFAEVVRPYLANKMHRTFIDRWLLEEDLRAYLEPWSYGRLNVVERILLGQRIRGEAAVTARHVAEQCELLSPDPERQRHLFESALKLSVLERSAGLGGKLAELQQNFEGKAAPRKVAPGAPAPAPAREPAEDALVVEEEMIEELEEEAAADDAPMARELADKSKDRMRRGRVRQLYRALEATKEYVEQNYWKIRIEDQDEELIEVNRFWRDFAAASTDQPFLSSEVAAAAGSFAEMMFALAVLDLPFEAGEHETKADGVRFDLRAATPLLLVCKELKEAAAPAETQPFLVRQDFFRLDDRYRFEGNQRFEKYITDEFLFGVGYGCRVVLTNLSSAPQRLELLNQIPKGAMPLSSGFFTRSVGVQLDPYSTTTLEYHFYFPAVGTFSQFPVHVSRDGQVVAFAAPAELKVVAELSEVDTSSWEHISQNGSSAEVLAFLDAANLDRIDVDEIAWRMRDREFFNTVITLLRRRHHYDQWLWAYGLYHEDEVASREYLRGESDFLGECGRALESPLVTIDPVERRAYQHIEYAPLFNPRAHNLGKRRTILNASFARQYSRLMSILCCRPKLDDEDWMSVTYYFLLQDRIEEALASFARVRPERLPMRLQFDYMRAYLDFFTDDHAIARGIAEKYLAYPVERWRNLFAEVVAQLDEAEGKGVARGESDERTREQTALAASEPDLELEVEARRVKLHYQNLERCQMRYYAMDIEFLFSTNPFVQQEGGSFAFVQPNRADDVRLAKGQNQIEFELPEEFRNANVLVEVAAGPLVKRQAYYANALAVQVIENYGHLRVSHKESGKPLPRAYVKVYRRLAGGQVRFHKDGYTDLRGRFDYVSISGEEEVQIQRFAILVMSEKDGALIREVAPPKE